MEQKKQIYSSSLIGTSIILLASLIRLNPIFGTICSFFSATQIASPLIGAFGGIGASIVSFAVRSLFYGLSHSMSIYSLFYHLPTLCASLYLATENRPLKAGIPFLCLVLFIINPIGSQAAIYSLYWLIPFGLALSNRKTFFLNALGSTFTAHAVGSVVFLYTKTTTPELWYALLPIVALERLVFATGMTATYHSIEYLKNHLKNYSLPTLGNKVLHG